MALTQADAGLLSPTNAQYTGFKNRIINGAMGIWQRGTSGFTTLNNYSADRWNVTAGTSLSAVAQSTDVPNGFKYSLSISGTNYPQTIQRIESNNSIDLVGQSVTVSFWLKQTSGAGSNSFNVALYYPNAVDNYASQTLVSNTLISPTSSWAYYSVTFLSMPSNVSNGLALQLNANTTGAATFLVTGVQLEKGSTATSFDYRPYGTELALCQRYYAKMSGGQNYTAFASGFAAGGSNAVVGLKYPTTMRTSPTVSQSNTGLNTPSEIAVTSLGASYLGADSAYVAINVAGGLTAGTGLVWNSNNNGAAYVDLTAEL